MSEVLLIKKLNPAAQVPEYMSKGAAGMDVRACVKFPVTIKPGETVLVPTGLAVAVPKGFEMQVRPRSGLAIKKSLTVINSPGTVDSDYRGEVGIGLVNHGQNPVEITNGMRVAQLVISPVLQPEVKVVENLDETERGEGGFGSTGVE